MPGGILVLLPIGRSTKKNKAGSDRIPEGVGMEALWAEAGIMRRQPMENLENTANRRAVTGKAQWRGKLGRFKLMRRVRLRICKQGIHRQKLNRQEPAVLITFDSEKHYASKDTNIRLPT